MLYTTLSNILLFNLIVSIINNFYDNVKTTSDAESSSILVLEHEKMKWDKKYGLLNFLPPPFNIISLPFCIILLFTGEKAKKWNLIFSKMLYCLIALIIFLILLVIGLISYPFAIIKSSIHSIHDEMNKPIFEENEKRRYGRLILDIIVRPFTLLYYFGYDLAMFWTLIFRKGSNKDANLRTFQLSKEYITSIRKILNDLKYKQKQKVVTLYDLYCILGLFHKKKLKNKKRYLFETTNTFDISASSESSKSINKTLNIEQALSLSNRSDVDKKEIQEIMKGTFRDILDKIVDTEGFVDIELALAILCSRAKYSQKYYSSLKYYNAKVLIKGIRKYKFKNDQSNGVYSFQKLRLLVYKLIIKFKLIYNYLSVDAKNKLKELFNSINDLPQFEKINEALEEYQRRDNDSEYNEGDEIPSFNLYEQKKIHDLSKIYSGNYSTNSNSNSNSGSIILNT